MRPTRDTISFVMLALALSWTSTALCQIRNPATVRVCSRDFCVESSPGGNTVFSCRHKPDSDRCHWFIPGWHRNIFVSDYGTVAVVHDGGRLLPLDYDPGTALIQLWKNGLMVRTIKASEVSGIRQRRNGSGYEWGVVMGFDQNSRIIVTTSAGERVAIADPQEPSYNYFPTAVVDDFRAQWYGLFLSAFSEPSLWERSKKSADQSYRFTWLRSFHHPVVVRIDVRPDGICELTAKVGLGSGGYDPGMLIRNETRPLTKEQSESFLSHIVLKFWNAPTEGSTRTGVDGAQWVIEGIKAGKYKVEDRWSPDTGPIHELGLAMAIGLAGLKIPSEEIY